MAFNPKAYFYLFYFDGEKEELDWNKREMWTEFNFLEFNALWNPIFAFQIFFLDASKLCSDDSWLTYVD